MKAQLYKLLVAIVFTVSITAFYGAVKYVADSLALDNSGNIVCHNTAKTGAFLPKEMQLCPKP